MSEGLWPCHDMTLSAKNSHDLVLCEWEHAVSSHNRLCDGIRHISQSTWGGARWVVAHALTLTLSLLIHWLTHSHSH